MQQIYVAHSRKFDYKKELYVPLRNANLNHQYTIILPHETDDFINSKEIIKQSHFVIAEVSFPSLGEGVELGWADSFNIPIICIYRKGNKPSGSLKTLTKTIIPYSSATDMISKLENFLSAATKITPSMLIKI